MDLGKRFPFLSDEERDLIISFEKGKTSQSEIAEFMLKLSDSFRAAVQPADRIKLRAKLLGLAGLY